MAQPVSLSERIKQRARALGFDAAGIASAAPPLDEDYARYERFAQAGFHGEMEWLAPDAGVRRRVDTADILPGARSVVCLARRYPSSSSSSSSGDGILPSIARYARGRDYHNGLRKKLRQLAAFVRGLGDDVQARPLCDDAPILERAWAARAGLGFVGKNGLLIVPGQGSFVLLGEVVTTLDLATDSPMPERCGACTRCLDACPTGALVSPFVLDARRCVSYLTIELRSPIPVELRAGVGDHLFGCDDCQTVCPFNASRKPAAPAPRRTTGTSGSAGSGSRLFEPLERWSAVDLAQLLTLEADSPAWATLSVGTPLHRATAEGLARNAAIVLGNRGDRAALPALESAARAHAAALVREAAAWAMDAIVRANAP